MSYHNLFLNRLIFYLNKFFLPTKTNNKRDVLLLNHKSLSRTLSELIIEQIMNLKLICLHHFSSIYYSQCLL